MVYIPTGSMYNIFTYFSGAKGLVQGRAVGFKECIPSPPKFDIQ